jgi:hypothetical protein
MGGEGSGKRDVALVFHDIEKFAFISEYALGASPMGVEPVVLEQLGATTKAKLRG